MNKRKLARLLSLILAVLMPILTATVAFAETEGVATNVSASTKYESPDISSLTGNGEEPEELSVSAGATYQEKAWYEYVTYSDHAVASYRLDDDHRILFYDPYTYTNSMVMDVQFDATTTEFDTMSEYTISKTTSKTISACAESTYTNTSAIQTSGRDEFGTKVENTGTTKTEYNHSLVDRTTGTKTDTTEYHYKKEDTFSWSLNESLVTGSSTSGTIGLTEASVTEEISISGGAGSSQNWGSEWLTDKVTNKTEYSKDYSTSTDYEGDDTVIYDTESKTEGWEQLSARVTKTLGSSSSTSTSWSESESTTVTKKYAATHFASDGVTPLPWAIVHYSVQMPMKSCLQVKYSGEWITISTVYCLLTTVQGTCRSWMQNGQVYYEDWGNGEPVVATDFWSQFMTKDQLMKAYSDKLYPVGGEN